MQCMKCGRETAPDQVFCPDCLSTMDRYPVKAGTHVSIPKRPPRVKTPPTKKINYEEVIAGFERRLHRMTIVIMVLGVLLGVTVGFLGYHFHTENHDEPAIGQNYSTESPADAPRRR